MSGTQSTFTTPWPDPMIMNQQPPANMALKLERGAVNLITPVGRLSYVHIKEPKAGPAQNGQPGALRFSSTILLSPNVVGYIWQAICMVADERWPNEQMPDPQNPANIISVKGSQMFAAKLLHNPLRYGDEAYMKSPQKHPFYRGTMTINAGAPQDQRPVVIDQHGRVANPDILYSGCYGRLSIAFFPFPKAGQQGLNKGVGAFLSAVQFAAPGERLAGFDAVGSAVSAFGAAPLPESMTAAADPGFGPNMQGFAAPPQAPAAAPAYAAPPTAPVAPPAYAQPPGQPPQAPAAAPAYAAPPAAPVAPPAYAQPPGQPPQAPPAYAVPPAPAPAGAIPPMTPQTAPAGFAVPPGMPPAG